MESKRSERAVSDVLAFTLVFAIILGSVAFLSTVGFQAMTDYQEGEQLRTADRAMISLADNFNDVLRYSGVTERYGELSLREGTVRTGTGGTRVNVSINGRYIGNHSGVALTTTNGGTFDIGRFEYSKGTDTIAYEGGGIVRSENGGGSVMLERPQLKCAPDRNRAVISLVAIKTANRSVQADGRVGLRLSSVNRETVLREEAENVSITVKSEYDTAWNTTFERTDWTTTPTSGVEATCESSDSGDKLTVVVTVVEATVEY
jgi:hypothetical protein